MLKMLVTSVNVKYTAATSDLVVELPLESLEVRVNLSQRIEPWRLIFGSRFGVISRLHPVVNFLKLKNALESCRDSIKHTQDRESQI